MDTATEGKTMNLGKSEYAQAGVDYEKIGPFKRAMRDAARRTLTFPNRRNVFVEEGLLDAHGGVFEYRGTRPFKLCQTTEGLGNKNWIAEWMYQFSGTGRTYYEGIGIDTVMMAANDNAAQGALPVTYTDEVAAGQDTWFEDVKRSDDLARSFVTGCELAGMALVAGESPALKFLINALPPITSAPSLSGTALGIIAPASRMLTGEKVAVGDVLIGLETPCLGANGISLVIKRALGLPEQFLTQISVTGRNLGEEALLPTPCYVPFVEGCLERGIDIHAFQPATGSGVGKVAFLRKPFTYFIETWPPVPPLFQFMQEIGVSLMDCLTTFNWGIGYWAIVHRRDVDAVLAVAKADNYRAHILGFIKEGERKVIFHPAGDLIIPAPVD